MHPFTKAVQIFKVTRVQLKESINSRGKSILWDPFDQVGSVVGELMKETATTCEES